MKNRLPVELENLELPNDEFSKKEDEYGLSYGYVSILSLLFILITISSVLMVIFLGNR